MRVGVRSFAAHAVLLIYSGVSSSAPPPTFDEWILTDSTTTTTECPTGYTCGEATTGAGFFQREIISETSESYFQTIITDDTATTEPVAELTFADETFVSTTSTAGIWVGQDTGVAGEEQTFEFANYDSISTSSPTPSLISTTDSSCILAPTGTDTSSGFTSTSDTEPASETYIGGGFFQREVTASLLIAPPNLSTTPSGHALFINLDPAHGGVLPTAAEDENNNIDFTNTNDTVIGPLPPGRHTLTWRAMDETGNTSHTNQTIDLIPTANFAIDQTSKEGGFVTVTVFLSGEAAEYPVKIPYTVSGSAISNPNQIDIMGFDMPVVGDHSAVDGEIIIEEGTQGGVRFSTFSDGITDDNESVVFTMGTPINAVAGLKTEHTVTISEKILVSRLSFTSTQAGKSTPFVTTQDGLITVRAYEMDINAWGSSYDWSESNNSLVNPDCTQSTFYVDPTNLSEGLYKLHVSVNQTSTAETWLRIGTPPALTNTDDGDGDGINDLEEGFGDNDSDGIPNFLDVIDAAHLIPGYWETRYKSLKDKNVNNEHIPAAGEVGWRITSANEHINYPMLIATQEGLKLSADSRNLWRYESLSGVAFPWTDFNNIEPAIDSDDDDLKHDEHFYVSLEISELPLTGAAAKLVIPQAIAVESPDQQQARVRGFDEDFGWNGFVEDANNQIASAKRVGDYCPSPHSARYQPGLIAGLECIRLTVEDGGPNDNDGYRNGRIAFTGGLVFKQAAEKEAEVLNTELVSAAATTSPDESGGSGPISLFLLAFAALALCFRHNRSICN